MKLQAVQFVREDGASPEYGFAKVSEFGNSDIEWIITYEGQVLKTVWNYWLQSCKPGHLAEHIG